ncbi:peptidylprolyl isomerase [Rheinheimera sp. SA_1]|uniref:FKBP-type peptidyl-prolyl cis-trans isomerase n=1 Tax=Rheinheimera sp. SA_1 TaxID=1827365 RepID=UPI000801A9C8|nr:FKBP-type peptidyl-prolyl cis-trans isomerase [Rheinheimera sp. SA_1]OBP13748.1 peptidylprolyl isomerase [Rheinheimera sp. SA_1]
MKIALIIIIIACIAYYFYNSANNQKNSVVNQEQGSVFLAENAKKDGVTTTASGLQYQVLQAGSGDRHPTATSTVRVHYHGTLINGTVFDSSVERGETISFPLNRVISGWTEGVQLMKVGDKFRFFIPSGLGYGNRSTGKIPAGSVLIFDVELFEIQ